jgi:hypothetical protein
MRIADSHKQVCRAEPHHFNADTDPSFHFNADPDPTFNFNADAGRILQLFKGMNICAHWSTDPPGFYFEPPHLQGERPGLHFDSLKLLNFDLYADPDPDFHSTADSGPDPASQNNADSCGSGSARSEAL